jgi:hypothetical protein
MGSTVKLLLTSALRSSVGALARGTTVDRDDIPRLGAAHDDRLGHRRQGWPSQADVNGVGAALISSTLSKEHGIAPGRYRYDELRLGLR